MAMADLRSDSPSSDIELGVDLEPKFREEISLRCAETIEKLKT